MTDEHFDFIARNFRKYAGMNSEMLAAIASSLGLPPAENDLEAVVALLRRDHGPENVRAFFQRCAELGIIT